MIRVPRAVASAVIATLSVWTALAQVATSEQTPLFRSESRQVIVDAIVTDAKGNYVRDLVQKDFRLWEDGKEQPIQSATRLASSSSPTAQKQYVVLYFDKIAFADQVRLRDAAIKFVETSVGQDRVVAVLQHEGNGGISLIQDFTDDVGQLKRAIGNAKSSALPTGWDRGELDHFA